MKIKRLLSLLALALGVALAGCVKKKIIEVWEGGNVRVEVERTPEARVSRVSDNVGNVYELKRLRRENDASRQGVGR